MNSIILGKSLVQKAVIEGRFNTAIEWKDENLTSEAIPLKDILNFNLNSVPNLYEYNPAKSFFKIDFTDHDMMARAITKVTPPNEKFKAVFLEEPMSICGINYMGKIVISHPDNVSFTIYLPGELTYDPAARFSNEEDCLWVDSSQFTLIIAFTVVLIKAAMVGAPKDFLKKTYLITKPIISQYYKKELLFRWMYKQVKFACIKKVQPAPYGEILAKRSFTTVLLGKQAPSAHTKLYLENYLKLKTGGIPNETIKIPTQYFEELKEDTEVEDEIKKAAEANTSRNNKHTLALTSLPILVEDTNGGPTIDEIEMEIDNICEGYIRAMDINFFKIEQLLKDGKRYEDPMEDPKFAIESSLSSQCPIF
ncbi:unnamed protein product [Blepharisma stoltei]|uniref:Uncharacterized protein n=1 Tax=Blepharisma stoltei TaxID=1481888 RepID=A0AAU9IQT4_9CILI|nr:unnamed protein product [Blepharisma stoltei]